MTPMPISRVLIRGHSTRSLFSIVMRSSNAVNEARNEYIDRMGGYYPCTVEGEYILESMTPAIQGDTNRLDCRGQKVKVNPWAAMLSRHLIRCCHAI